MKHAVLAATLLTLGAPAWAAGAFTLKADDIPNGHFGKAQQLSARYGFGCSGDNASPALSWRNAPKGTRSFVLTIHDPDALTGVGWMHWVVANIPADVNHLPDGITAEGDRLPAGALQTRTDFGVPGYGGPCPPQGSRHRYVITLTALKIDRLPSITAEATPAMVGFFANANALGKAKVVIMDQR